MSMLYYIPGEAKTIPFSFYCSVYICRPMSIILGTQYTEIMRNTKIIDLSTSPTLCCCTSFEHFERCLLRCVVGSEMSRCLVPIWGCIQTLKWTRTTDDRSENHWQLRKQSIKRLMKFATASLMCSCGSSSRTVCKATFNSSIVLAEFMVLFQHGGPDVIAQWVQIWIVWGSTDSSQWTQDNSLAASPAWRALCELGRRFAGRWSLDCLCDCSADSGHFKHLQ